MKSMLLSYLKQRRGLIGLFALFAAIFLLVFILYGLPVEAVLYPLGLCITVGLLVLAWDFHKTFRCHRILCAIQSMTDAVTMTLPAADDILDADYQKIIGLLCREHTAREQI